MRARAIGASRLSRWAIALVAPALAAGCQSGATDTPASRATTAPAADSAPPPLDHLAPDELLESDKIAFGVKLPRGLVVMHEAPMGMWAKGPVSVHALAKYFHARLVEGTMREGDEAATFDHVRAPGVANRLLLVTIRKERDATTSVRIEDLTLPPAPDMTQAERWRAVGLTPEGKLIDPTHLN